MSKRNKQVENAQSLSGDEQQAPIAEPTTEVAQAEETSSDATTDAEVIGDPAVSEN